MRDLFVIALMCIAAIVVGALLFFSVPKSLTGTPDTRDTSTDDTAEVSVPFVELASGTQAEVLERKNYVARDEDAYARLLEMTGNEAPQPIPLVDFSRQNVIGIFAGEQPSGGYAVGAETVTDVGNVRTIEVELVTPGEGCITTQALTSPFVLIAVPASLNDPEAVDTVRETSCS